MSRIQRASTAATLTYIRFGLSLVLGIALVPFVLSHVGVRMYGFWLASGEVLAYAAMADFGILSALPWMIAEADGRGNRDGIRRLISTGFGASVIVSVVYLALAFILWQVAPAILQLQAEERAAIAGPLALIACGTALILPLRLANVTLMALQDVKVLGVLGIAARVMEVALVVTLLLLGYGLYALAVAAVIPSALVALVSIIRLHMVAPDLLRGWSWPSMADLRMLFSEGLGAWLGSWSWQLTAAANALILTSLGSPVWVTVLAMTSKLSHVLMQMAWVPGDSGLVGLANLAGENKPDRLRPAAAALMRVYLTLVTAAACAILAVNAPFVRGWLGPELFGGLRLSGLVVGLMIVLTAVHGLTTIGSALGHRRQIGAVSFGSACVQVPLAILLTGWIGLPGVPLAALMTQSVVLIPALVWAMPPRSGLTLRELAGRVLGPWSLRAVPLLAMSGLLGLLVVSVHIALAIALGALIGAVALWVSRGLLLDYPPLATMIRDRLALVRLDGLVTLSPLERPPQP